MKNAIEIRGLCKSFGDFALDHIDLTLPGGSIMGLIGENGAGKTTTIKCILNLIRRDAGEISIWGRDNLREERAAKAGVGVVLDECFFHDSLRPRDLDRVLGPVFPDWDRGLYGDYLDKFRLPANKLIREFSRGMKMKLSLAAALAQLKKKILVIDLDPQANATSGMGIDGKDMPSLYPALLGQLAAEECILPSGRKRLDIIPSTMDLAGVEIELARSGNHLTRLRETLAPLRESDAYDYCIMDTPPSLGVLMTCALAACVMRRRV